MNIANWITLLRFPLLVAVVVLLYLGGAVVQFVAVALIVVLILMDTVDGIVARRRGEQTLLGSALDIAADRAVEFVLWVTYAQLDVISVAVPLVVIIRGALTDAIRSAALRRGLTAHTMMRSKWGHWLVASSAMRVPYSVAKGFSFGLLALALGLRSARIGAWYGVWLVGAVLAWISVAFCVVRGLPVIIEAPALFQARQP